MDLTPSEARRLRRRIPPSPFEPIGTSMMVAGLSSGAALATVVGVLIEVPLMLLLVRVCLRTQSWFTPPADQVV